MESSPEALELGIDVVATTRGLDDVADGQLVVVDGGAMTGYGEDLRPVVRERMAELQAKHAAKK